MYTVEVVEEVEEVEGIAKRGSSVFTAETVEEVADRLIDMDVLGDVEAHEDHVAIRQDECEYDKKTKSYARKVAKVEYFSESNSYESISESDAEYLADRLTPDIVDIY
jgi:hypothetical protein